MASARSRSSGSPSARPAPRRRGLVAAGFGLVPVLLIWGLVAGPPAWSASAGSGSPSQGGVQGPLAPEPTSPVVTYENLYELERFWPYHVRLTENWKPEGFQGERFSYGIGVLVRVEPSGLLRVDFARFGIHLVPARATDVIEAANRIRRGETEKMGPNFVVAVGPRLLDPSSERLQAVRAERLGSIGAYLVVVADPSSERFAEIASALGSIGGRERVLPVLFPQGDHKDGAVWQLCRKAGWSFPFVRERFVKPYTESFLGKDPELPSALLASPEGRTILSTPWSPDAAASLAAAIDRELGPKAASASSGHSA